MGSLPSHIHPESACPSNGHPSSRSESEEWCTLVCYHVHSCASSIYQTTHLGLVLSFHLLAPRNINNGAINHSMMVREDFSPSHSTRNTGIEKNNHVKHLC